MVLFCATWVHEHVENEAGREQIEARTIIIIIVKKITVIVAAIIRVTVTNDNKNDGNNPDFRSSPGS